MKGNVKPKAYKPTFIKHPPKPDPKTERNDNCGDYRVREVKQDYKDDEDTRND